jgi:hypothetical protein
MWHISMFVCCGLKQKSVKIEAALNYKPQLFSLAKKKR